MAVFFGEFVKDDDVFDSFEVAKEDRENCELLVAAYDTPPYEGYAFVFLRDVRDGKFYEVHGAHCSCYGLEEQWHPEESNVDELLKRPVFAGYTYSESELDQEQIRAALRAVVGA